MNAEYIDYLAAQYEYAAPTSAQDYSFYSAYGQSAPTGYDYGTAPAVDPLAAYGMSYDPSYGYYDPSYALSMQSSISLSPMANQQVYMAPTYSDSAPVASTSSHYTPQMQYVAPLSPFTPSHSHSRSTASTLSISGASAMPSGQMSDSDLSSASTRSRQSAKSSRSSMAASAGGSKDKRFICPACGEGFARNFNLKSHIACKHNGEKPFECIVCPKTFSRKHDTARHLTARHGYSQASAQEEVQRRYPTGCGSLSN